MTEGLPPLHTIEVPRTARYAQLGQPSAEVRELWIVLHGYRQLADRFLRRFNGIAAPNRLIAAPEALNRFYVGDQPGRHGPESRVGGTWMTRLAREIEIGDYVRYLDLLTEHLQRELSAVGSRPVRIVILGFSQGVHTAARWTSLGRVRAQDLIFWGEHLPTDLDSDRATTAWQESRVHLVRGLSDTHHLEDRTRDESEMISGWGCAAEIHTHPDGHRIEPGLLARLADSGS